MAITFEIPKVKGLTKKCTADWLISVAKAEGGSIQRIHYKSFNRNEMIKMNAQFLGHNYDTDIITFSVKEHPESIESDFALGWDQIHEQAVELNESFIRELHRIFVHGLLHCLGYNDQSEDEQEVMRAKEDYYLNYHPECSTWNN